MVPNPFPDRWPDGQEPDGSGLLPAGGTGPDHRHGGPGDDGMPPGGPEQGLYVCLSAERLTLAGFAEGGQADTMAPGPLLATVVEAILGPDGAGLAGLADDQLMGIISAARRMESRIAWMLLAAIGELASRRPAGRDEVSEFAADELAGELHLTWQSAAAQLDYARAVAGRLPRTFAALADGKIHPVHVRIIEDETRVLSEDDVARADEILARMARGSTFGQLRYAARRLVLKLDPDAARRRKEAARQDGHVRRFREDSGNAGMIARELPSDEILASWQHIEQRALDLRAAGLPGTLRELRVRAYLDLLQERDSRTVPGDPGPAGTAQADPAQEARGGGEPGGPAAGNSPGGPDPRGAPGACPAVAALVNITVPLATVLAESGTPGEVGGFGLLDGQDTRDMVAAAARHPRTRWCLTALHPDGTAAAHGCAPGRHLAPPGPDPPPDARAGQFLRRLRVNLAPVARGRCDHRHAETGYQPSRRLRHLINARSTRCTAPGCGRPAARCDLDHTIAWQRGGLTCECGLAPLCRHHHRCKQAEGWWLEQPQPGVLAWTTPAGRHYVTQPTAYPA